MKTFVKLSMLLGLAVASAVPAMAQECQDPPTPGHLGAGATVEVVPGASGAVAIDLSTPGVDGSISVDRKFLEDPLIECDFDPWVGNTLFDMQRYAPAVLPNIF